MTVIYLTLMYTHIYVQEEGLVGLAVMTFLVNGVVRVMFENSVNMVFVRTNAMMSICNEDDCNNMLK